MKRAQGGGLQSDIAGDRQFDETGSEQVGAPEYPEMVLVRSVCLIQRVVLVRPRPTPTPLHSP